MPRRIGDRPLTYAETSRRYKERVKANGGKLLGRCKKGKPSGKNLDGKAQVWLEQHGVRG